MLLVVQNPCADSHVPIIETPQMTAKTIREGAKRSCAMVRKILNAGQSAFDKLTFSSNNRGYSTAGISDEACTSLIFGERIGSFCTLKLAIAFLFRVLTNIKSISALACIRGRCCPHRGVR